MQAKQMLYEVDTWIGDRARLTMPILLQKAKTGQTLSYTDLDKTIVRQYNRDPIFMMPIYGKVLEIVGRALNALSEEWRTELPPLTILVINRNSGEPGAGVEDFLQRYISKSAVQAISADNRRAMIDRATSAVHNYPDWDKVAAYFDVQLPSGESEAEPIPLETPPARLGPESEAHLALKAYVAGHPELFASDGRFDAGQLEYRLPSGDEIDVFFRNDEQALAVEIKTAEAPLGELTRGLYQCVKYRAVLRAMYTVAGELVNVQSILVTPQSLPLDYQMAANRLGVLWLHVAVEG